MPITICNVFLENCSPDWDGVSAIATLSATLAALAIPILQRISDNSERKKSLGYSLLLKVIKIHSDIFHFWEHIEESRKFAQNHCAEADCWQFFRPLANIPNPVVFSSDELALLFSLRDDEIFNFVLSLDEMHAADLKLMQMYGEKREALTNLLPGGVMEGAVGSIGLNSEEYLKFAPMSVQLDMLVSDIAQNIERHLNHSKKALIKLQGIITAKTRLKVKIALPDDPIELKG